MCVSIEASIINEDILQAEISLYHSLPDGSFTWNPDHIQEVLEGKAGINDVTNYIGFMGKAYRKEMRQMRLGTEVANKKV